MSTLVYIILLSPVVVILLYFCLKYPEIPFSIFIFIGYIKDKPWIESINEYFDITLLFIIITLIGLGFHFIKNKDEWLHNIRIDPRLLVPYLFLCFMVLISFNYTGSPIYGLEKMTRFMAIITLVTFLPYFLFWKDGSMERFFLPIVLLAVFTGAQILLLGFQKAMGDIVENYIASARLGGIALIATLFYLLRLKGKTIIKIFYWVSIPFVLLTLLAPGGRGPIIAAVISVVLVLLYMLIRKPAIEEQNINASKVLRAGLFATIIVIIIVGIFLTAIFPQLFGKTESRISGLFTNLSKDVTYAARIDLYRVALDSMFTFPATLIGLGVGGYNEAYGGIDTSKGSWPHNIFLEVGSELGLLSLIVFLYLIYRSIKIAFLNINKAKTRDGYYLSVTLLIMFIYMIINASVSGDINENRVLFLIIGLVFALRNKSIVESSESMDIA